jgi:hypothetical protein
MHLRPLHMEPERTGAADKDDMGTILIMLEAQRSLIHQLYAEWIPPEGFSEQVARLIELENRLLRQQIEFLQRQINLLNDRFSDLKDRP